MFYINFVVFCDYLFSPSSIKAHFIFSNNLNFGVNVTDFRIKPDIPCLLTHKLQPVLVPEKIAKPHYCEGVCGHERLCREGSELRGFPKQNSHQGADPLLA